jgi:serine/threonine protein kinase
MNSEPGGKQVIAGRYSLLGAIGQGAMSHVHLARDEQDGRQVAIKWLSPSRRSSDAYRTRLRLEAELLAQVRHPHVVQLFDFGMDEDIPYLVLEVLNGETLLEYLDRCGPMPLSMALPLIVQLASALQAVHGAGLIHGDVKPHNVFLCGQPGQPESVKLIDFGFAQAAADDSLHDGDTITGTLEYMAPEQIMSERLDHRSDIYSFGIVLFRWLTGELPFDTGRTLGLFAHQLVSAAPPPSWLVDGFHPGLERVILATVRKNPENRYASMQDILADLACVESGNGEVRGAPLVQEPDRYQPSSDQARRAWGILHRAGWTDSRHPSDPPIPT